MIHYSLSLLNAGYPHYRAVESPYGVVPMEDAAGNYIYHMNPEQQIYHAPLPLVPQPLRDPDPYEHEGVMDDWLPPRGFSPRTRF